MKLEALVNSLNARVLCGSGVLAADIEAVYAGDTMSDLLEHAGSRTLVATNLANLQLVRVAQLMDLPGICLVEGTEPMPELVQAAAETGTALFVSPYGLFETCGRLYAAMQPAAGASG